MAQTLPSTRSTTTTLGSGRGGGPAVAGEDPAAERGDVVAVPGRPAPKRLMATPPKAAAPARDSMGLKPMPAKLKGSQYDAPFDDELPF